MKNKKTLIIISISVIAVCCVAMLVFGALAPKEQRQASQPATTVALANDTPLPPADTTTEDPVPTEAPADTPTPEPTSTPVPPTETPAPEAFTIGQDVIVGDVRWKILEAKELGQELKSDNQFIEAKTTTGKFILVRLEVENRKTEAATYAGINAIDDKNRTFEVYNEKFGFVDEKEACIFEQLNPNLTKVCSEIFELPADAKGIKVGVGDLELFGGDEALIVLGF